MSRTFELLDPHQSNFVNSYSRFLLNSGGVGSGKTYSIILKTLKLIMENPGIFILIGAQTYTSLRDTVLREFLALVPPEIISSYNKSLLHFTFTNGSEVIFRSLDDEAKLKSLNLGAVAIDEMTEIDEEIFKMLRTRLRQENMPCCLYGATNPSTFGNWVYKYFIEKPITGSEVVYSISADNDYLPVEYLNDLDTLKKSNPEYYSRMVMGKWGALEGLIYDLPMSQRVVNPVKPYQRYIAGLDFGYDHPTAFLIAGVINGVYYIIDELYERKMTPDDIADRIKTKMEQYEIDIIYADGSRPEIIEHLNRLDIPAVGADKAVFDGLMTVKQLINTQKLYIDAKECPMAIREFDSYVWDKKNKVKEIPIKLNDDSMDAIRYLCYSDLLKNGGDISSDFESYGGREFE